MKTKLFTKMENFITTSQANIVKALQEREEKTFTQQKWERKEGGGGLTIVLDLGKTWEKAGVNTSSIQGKLPLEIARLLKLNLKNIDDLFFYACGLSIVIHPVSPMIPTIHMNVRRFEIKGKNSWFGGGIDLTPYYPFKADFMHFHQTMKAAVGEKYPIFKERCDEYFTLKHRQEMRGIGGIFFDHLNENPEKDFLLVTNVVESFLKAYLPIVDERKQEKYSQKHIDFQRMRRGRYVEFNLLYDRGTLFGLKTNGRIESIFMSFPHYVEYPYNYIPAKGNDFEQEMTHYYQPKEWIKS